MRFSDKAALTLTESAMRLRYWRPIYRMIEVSGDPTLKRFAVPQTANQKFTWRKIFDRNPDFPVIADKIAVRDWLARNNIALPMAEQIWVGDSADDIPETCLGGPYWLKASHGSGMNIDLATASDMGEVRARARRFLAKTYGRNRGEWFYYDLPHRLVIERSVAQGDVPVDDFKFYTFGEQVTLLCLKTMVNGARQWLNYRDHGDGLSLEPPQPGGVAPRESEKPDPAMIARLKAEAIRIGARFDAMRVDFMVAGGEYWLGELTLTSDGGMITGVEDPMGPDTPEARAWDIRRAHFLTGARPCGCRRLYRDALLRSLA